MENDRPAYTTFTERAAIAKAKSELLIGLADVARLAMFEVLTDTFGVEPRVALKQVDQAPLEIVVDQLGVDGVDETIQIAFAQKIGRQLARSYFKPGTVEDIPQMW